VSPLLEALGIDLPIIQAPMAGVSSPAMAAAVSNAGALGSIGVGATDADGAQKMIAAVRERSARSLNVNVFCHQPPRHGADLEAWLMPLRPHFEKFGAEPPARLEAPYRSFLEDDAKLAALVAARPRVVSVHFGLPSEDQMRALRAAGIRIIATATCLAEGCVAAAAGVDAIVAQGYEAGGHRGMFDPDAPDACLGTPPLVRLLAQQLRVPIIAAGGIMDGAGIAAALRLGAVAAQLGTAFIACPESEADEGFRATLMSDAANHTFMTGMISGRPARCLRNAYAEMSPNGCHCHRLQYPIPYAAAKALHAVAKAAGDYSYGPYWAGQGATLARALPAADLVTTLAAEIRT
jgi:nitronate monooxygenase